MYDEYKVRIMQILTKADKASIDKLQGLISQRLPIRERKARQYIIDAFKGKMSSLIPFSFQNESIIKMASYLLKYTTGSNYTLYQYVFGVHRFSKWLGKNPDEMVKESLLDKKTIGRFIEAIDDFVGDMQAEGLAPGTINNHVKGVKALFRVNGVTIILPYRLPKKVKYHDRSPIPEELSKIIDLAAVREKVIISMLALSGIRIGTLVKLQYRHVRRDLERGVVPIHIHIHIEAEITKGKYHDYDTFIGSKAVEYLKTYLNVRRNGTRRDRWGMPPEKLTDESPLIRAKGTKTVKSITPGNVHRAIHKLYLKAGILKKGNVKRYELRVHSIRKYFRTQLGSLSTIPTDYIDYMMGHTVSTYNDVKMKGIDFLRNLYASSGLSIKPKIKTNKIDQLKLIIEAWGMNPDEILSKQALSMPHRTTVTQERGQIEVLNKALKQAIIKELQTH